MQKNNAKVLVLVNDDEWRSFFSSALDSEYEISCHSMIDDIKKELELRRFEAIFLDLGNRQESTFELLDWIKDNYTSIPVIITSQHEKAEIVVRTIKSGAYDFIIRPISAVKLRHIIHQALENQRLKNEIDYLRHEQDIIYSFDQLVAVSQPMKTLVENLKKFSKTESTILMTGETGTGKSFFSGTIHYNSQRRNKPFIKINCANLPENLLESELFGHEKGAFTGAGKLRIGRFEQAHGGTLFLDEIGELGPALQAKLLRVLEEKSFERLGGNQTIQVDVRVITATNKNLENEVRAGRFREDLFYRVNILSVKVPPLRNRKQDLEPLSNWLLRKTSRSMKKKITGFSEDAMKWITAYDWPGNIRQLQNVIERAIILEESDIIRKENLPIPELEGTAPSLSPESSYSSSDPIEKQQIIDALEKNLWIQKDAARWLQVSPRVLNYKIKKYDITHPRWRKNK